MGLLNYDEVLDPLLFDLYAICMTFYFYDLETSGIDPREQRIMQFAGQRTDMNLEPVGEPDNILIKLTADVLPDPESVLITGITPQKTLIDGITEEEFLKYFEQSISTDDTIFVGFNTVRFDDEFMRYTLYRNLRDPYAWQWKDGRSRWDLLDIVRMTRALRPDGIQWPFASNGKAANRLGLLAELNGLIHTKAHDALSDVEASIQVAKLIKDKQPKLFSYMLDMRDKKSVEALVQHFAEGEFGSSYVFDLRHDPSRYLEMSDHELTDLIKNRYRKEAERPPFKELKFNKCPAVAPLAVLDDISAKRLEIDKAVIQKHADILNKNKIFGDRVIKIMQSLTKAKQAELYAAEKSVDSQLYDGFVPADDMKKALFVRTLPIDELIESDIEFKDDRLNKLFWLYKVRQYPKNVISEDREKWYAYVEQKLMTGSPSKYESYMKKLEDLAKADYLDADKRYLIEELALYGQSLIG
jgi:exodeoxyribonuclease I